MKATTKITKDEYGEYRVRLFIDGEYQAGADYFTDDKRDASGTAKLMVATSGISDKDCAEARMEQREYEQGLN